MIQALCRQLNFPEEAAISLALDYEKIAAVPGCIAKLQIAMDDLYLKEGKQYVYLLKEVAVLSEVHPYSVDMLFTLCCAKYLRYIYRQQGWSEEIFFDSMTDLRCKVQECHQNYGVWGCSNLPWFRLFFLGRRHGLGRLQYDKGREFKPADYKGIKTGDPIYKCHIPSSGPLTLELVMDSLKKAYDFYKPEDGVLKVVCDSWILYPPHYELLPEGGNLRAFCDLFTVLDSKPLPENPEIWRIFGTLRERDYSKLPEDNTLRRNFKKFLMDGNCMGMGYGILFFDGEKISK